MKNILHILNYKIEFLIYLCENVQERDTKYYKHN